MIDSRDPANWEIRASDLMGLRWPLRVSISPAKRRLSSLSTTRTISALLKFHLQVPFEAHHHDRLARSLRDLFDQFNFLLHPILNGAKRECCTEHKMFWL